MKLTSSEIRDSLFERLAQLNEVSEWGYITITISGDVKDNPNFCVNVATRNTSLSESGDIDKAVKAELAKHSSTVARKSEATSLREQAEHMLKQAAALEAEEASATK